MTLVEKIAEAKKKLKETGTITKYFRAEVKDIDTDNHKVSVTISDQSVDSYSDIIDVNGWKKHLNKFNQRSVLLSSHNYGDLRKQIGASEKTFVKDDALRARLEYFTNKGNQEADWGWHLVEKKVAAYSVGFKPKAMRYWSEMTEDEQKEARKKYKIPSKVTPFRIFLEQELMEVSQVTMPANTNAVQDGLKDEDCVVRKTAEDISVIAKAEAEADLKSSDPDIKREAEEYLGEIENKLWEDEEGWKEIKYRIKNPDLFVDDSFRRKKMPGVSPTVIMVIAKLKSDPDGSTMLQSLRFPKISWTLAKAKTWVREHPDIGKTIEELEAKGLDALEDAPEDVKLPVKPEQIVKPGELEAKEGEPKGLSDEDKEAIKQLTTKVSELIEKIGGAGGKSGDKPMDDAEDQNLYAEILKSGKDALNILKPQKKE